MIWTCQKHKPYSIRIGNYLYFIDRIMSNFIISIFSGQMAETPSYNIVRVQHEVFRTIVSGFQRET